MALRDAFCEALYDIGGKTCFAKEWKRKRDVPEQVVYPRTPEGHHLWHNQNPLVPKVCVGDNDDLPSPPSRCCVHNVRGGTLYAEGRSKIYDF